MYVVSHMPSIATDDEGAAVVWSPAAVALLVGELATMGWCSHSPSSFRTARRTSYDRPLIPPPSSQIPARPPASRAPDHCCRTTAGSTQARRDGHARKQPQPAARSLRAFVTLLVVAHHAVLAYHPYAPPPASSLTAPPMLWMAFPVVDSQRGEWV